MRRRYGELLDVVPPLTHAGQDHPKGLSEPAADLGTRAG